jgi:AraC-like DNA-binding protein
LLRQLPIQQFCSAAVVVGSTLFHEVSGLYPRRIMVARSYDAQIAKELQAAFVNTKIEFDSYHYAINYQTARVNALLAGADTAARIQYARRVQAFWSSVDPDLVDRIRQLLISTVTSKRAHMDALSTTLNMHPRTLNRRLHDRGTSLRRLVNETRFEIAGQLLRDTSLPTSDISDALGYSEPSVFTRAFRVWSGMPPSDWRRSKRQPLERMMQSSVRATADVSATAPLPHEVSRI